jgi:pimeloyl-ACP methyl ester carboxylesterase
MPHILFIPGAWLSADCWIPWRERYERAGHRCLAPGWPRGGAGSGPSIDDLLAHYAAFAASLTPAPILIGHSFGGLLVQLLLDRGVGSVGIVLGSLPPGRPLRGLFALRTALALLAAWLRQNGSLPLSFRRFAVDFAQTLTPDQQRAAYQRFAFPAPRRVFLGAFLGKEPAGILPGRSRAPLLLVAGEHDKVATPAVVQANYRRQQAAAADTAFRLFPGRSHWLIGEPGWEDIADYCLAWAQTRTVEP